MTIMNVLSLFGGLGLFLFGMQLMGEALEKAAGTRLKKLLGMVTGNRFLAMLAGITITAVVQSSSGDDGHGRRLRQRGADVPDAGGRRDYGRKHRHNGHVAAAVRAD